MDSKNAPQQDSKKTEAQGSKHDHEHHKSKHQTEEKPHIPHDSHDHQVDKPEQHK